ncbi:hypothetical protein PghCCS26_41940 [Paenibacillus glycanilyticus]|uniref:Large polyvalent protein associated domain-containing protein n=1 Tax=Paenibacillus glycanilyticus TaxID=126569 RepID=A0ABQ6NQL6_9BACL|nr:hypothetical protein [Paenibacillus glycanilyticus]GMK47064.1 hypothetical protein PghCCS26_41940 [Paenibacillus glycanilyticus]
METMSDWQNIKISGIASIRKCVGEFEVGELIKTPYSKFIVKVFEGSEGDFTGYTNLLVKDKDGTPYPGIGRGFNVEETLRNTILNFLEMLDMKEIWHEDDFEIADPFDF